MYRKLMRGIARRVPSSHWLPIAAVAGIVLIFVVQDVKETIIAALQGRHAEQQEAAPAKAIVHEVSADAGQPEVAALPAIEPAPYPAEPMVPVSFVEVMMSDRERQDERWSKIVASRDRQIDDMQIQITQMHGQIGQQEQQLAELRSEQLKSSWDQAERLRQQTMLGVPSRLDAFPIPEQNGPQPAPRKRAAPQPAPAQPPVDDADDPFDAGSAATEQPTASPRSLRRPGYLNVSPKNRSTGSGRSAGSAGARLERQEDRYRAAVDWTRKYYSYSGSSRVLSEMERGGR